MTRICKFCGHPFEPAENELYCPSCTEVKRRKFMAIVGKNKKNDMPETKQAATDDVELIEPLGQYTIKQARIQAAETISNISTLLCISYKNYYNCEVRNCLPADKADLFCKITGIFKNALNYRETTPRKKHIKPAVEAPKSDNKSIESDIKTMENVIKNVRNDMKPTETDIKPAENKSAYLPSIQLESEKLRAMYMAILVASENELKHDDLNLAMSAFSDMLQAHIDNISRVMQQKA